MNIREAIREIDEMCPNTVDKERKIRWLDRVDRHVWSNVIMTHERRGRYADMPGFFGYNLQTPDTTELLIDDEHAEIYKMFLEMQIYLRAMEIEKYNNAANMYNNAMQAYKAQYNREHMPRAKTQMHF